jgi:hypothetical protein
MGRERKASKGLVLAPYMDDAIVKLMELGSGSAQARAIRKVKRRPQGECEEEGNVHRLLTSLCDDASIFV